MRSERARGERERHLGTVVIRERLLGLCCLCIRRTGPCLSVCGSELTNKSLCMHTRVNICYSVPLMRPKKLCHDENCTSVNQNKHKFNATLKDGRAPNVAQMLRTQIRISLYFIANGGECSCCPLRDHSCNICYIDATLRYVLLKK